MFAANIPESPLRTVEELTRVLGDKFILFCGSAISGVNNPKLPMVWSFESDLLKAIANRLSSGGKTHKLVSEYALDLIDENGKNYETLNHTKFEKFLWYLQLTFGRDKLDQLLYDIYVCTDDQYGPNHVAISYLLEHGYASLCLTTNFDNTIELSYPKSNLQVIDYSSDNIEAPDTLSLPTLIKLHGDAVNKTCVASAPQFSDKVLRSSYQFLENFLKGHNILVLGYSGTGDVDIAPHIRKADAKLFWCDLPENSAKKFREDQFNIYCDLTLNEGKKNGTSNILIELARFYGADISWEGERHNNPDKFNKWIQQFELKQLEDFVVSLLSWGTSWPHVHIMIFRGEEEKNKLTQLNIADALVQVALYNSSIPLLESYLEQESNSSSLSLDARTKLAFAYWRKGNFDKTVELLQPIMEPKFWQSLNILEKGIVLAATRNYLEMVIELMQYQINPARRKEIYVHYKVEEIVAIFQRLQNEIGSDYIGRVALVSVEALSKTEVNFDTLNQLFEECIAMEEWDAASLLTQLTLYFSVSRGIKALLRVQDGLLKQRMYKHLLKNLAFTIYSLIPGHPPLILKTLNGRLIMPVMIAWLERKYHSQRKRWIEEYKEDKYNIYS